MQKSMIHLVRRVLVKPLFYGWELMVSGILIDEHFIHTAIINGDTYAQSIPDKPKLFHDDMNFILIHILFGTLSHHHLL